MNVYETIKKIRKTKDFTQAEVAEKLGVAPSNYTMLEQGKTELTYSKMIKLAEIFGVSVVELLGEGASVVAVGGGEGAKEIEALKARLESLERENKDLREILQFTKKAFYDMTESKLRFSGMSFEDTKKEMEKIRTISIVEAEAYAERLMEHAKQNPRTFPTIEGTEVSFVLKE